MPRDVIVDTRKLTKIYRDFWGRQKKRALNALNLQIQRGEIFGLLGPNGSGKTTTIKLLLGLLFPTDGEAFVFGQPAADVRKNERVGYLPEESYLYRFLNAEETLDFYGRLFKLDPAVRRERAAKLIETVGLANDKKRILKEYSKGMRQRIGLAQALINDPEFVILDEPTSGLDPLGTRWMKDLIIDLRNKGKTVIMCSHRLDDVQDVCDRIAILHQGELKELGRVDELLTVQDVTQLRASGFNAVPDMVALQRKVSFPLVTLVMTLLGVPFAVTTGRRGALYGVGVGIVLAIVYWTTLSVFAAMGAGGLVAPTLAAWAPNILFGAAAAYMVLTVRT